MSVLLVSAIIAVAPASDRVEAARFCQEVHGRYEIKVENDFLWVVGSRHVIEVSVPALDKELEAQGWKTTAAYGDFTICSTRRVSPYALTIQDFVVVRKYSNIRYVRH